MSVRLIVDESQSSDAVAMYCSTSGFAFGPVFDSETEALDFLEWMESAKREDDPNLVDLGSDPRRYMDSDLEDLVAAWKKQYDEVAS